MNNHWLQENFKDTSTEELQAELWQLESFNGSAAMVKMINAELVRRRMREEDER